MQKYVLQTRVAHSWRRLMVVYRVQAARNILHDRDTGRARRMGRRNIMVYRVRATRNIMHDHDSGRARWMMRRMVIVYRVRAARNIVHDPNTVAARTGRRHQDVAVVTICRAGEGRRWTRCRHRHGEHQSHEEKAAPALGVGGRHS